MGDCAGRGVGGILGSSWSQVGYPEHWSPRAPDKSRWVTKWKPALNAFLITFTDRTLRQRITENENVIYTIGRTVLLLPRLEPHCHPPAKLGVGSRGHR